MDVEELRFCLDRILTENSTTVSKAAIETLLKIHRNIKFNENEPKYRKLKLQNAVFKNQVWNLHPARDFMLMSGWVEQKEEHLRAKAAIERQKELDEYKKEKLYREKLAENVKKQIADDRKNRRQYVNTPNPRNKEQPHYQINRKLDS